VAEIAKEGIYERNIHMMRSMFAGVSGIRAHQTMMDVIGNNVANVNTVGFKASRVLFSDALSQLVRGASGGTGEATGGVNPQQVGLGTKVAGIEMLFTQGGSQLTGNATDVSIQGDGFFAVRGGTETLYTRAGAFSFDHDGALVDGSGAIVQGWLTAPNGTIDRNAPVNDIRVRIGQAIDPSPTTSLSIRGNLSATTAVGDPPVTTALDVVDGQGNNHRLTFSFAKTAANTWTLTGLDPASAPIGTATLVFDPATGLMTSPTTPPSFTYTPAGASAVTFTVDLGAATGDSRLTQFGSGSDPQAVSQNGSGAGVLRSFAIGSDGTLSGVYSNGRSKPIAQLSVANFANPKGLIAAGDSKFRRSNAAGEALMGSPGIGGRGELNAGTLEMSNVELAQEFTNLILAQRGFQASSRVITASDEMIQDLVNLRR
jgi:flagellar hook protein FlgE